MSHINGNVPILPTATILPMPHTVQQNVYLGPTGGSYNGNTPLLPQITGGPNLSSAYWAVAGATGSSGGGLPAGTDGAYLYHNGANWVAQTNPILMGSNNQVPTSCVGIGQNNTMGLATNTFVIGNGVKLDLNPDSSVDIGDSIAMNTNNSVAIGSHSYVAGDSGIAIGTNASVGESPQGVSIGVNAGYVANSKDGTINIGQSAGNAGAGTNQGTNAINIGKNAGANSPGSADNSITLNASGTNFSAVYSSLYVNPVLASTMTNYLSYDPASGLVGYGAPTAVPSFSLITLGPTALNTLAANLPDEFTIASGDLNTLLPSGHSYLITVKVSWDLTQNTGDSNFTTTLTSNSFVNPLIVWGSGASPTTYSTAGLFTTNYVGSNSYFGGNAGGGFPSGWDTTLSGIINIPFNATMATYFILQFAKATYTAPAGAVAINQFNFTAVQLS